MARSKPFQFRLRTMLWAITLCAAFLSLVKTVGPPLVLMVALTIAGCVVFSAVLMFPFLVACRVMAVCFTMRERLEAARARRASEPHADAANEFGAAQESMHGNRPER